MPNRLLVLCVLFISINLMASYGTNPKNNWNVSLEELVYKISDTTETKSVDSLVQGNESSATEKDGDTLFAAGSDTTEAKNSTIDSIDVDTTEVDTVVVDTTVVKEEKISYWTKTNTAGVNLNEVAFINWNSGGNNSISALTHANFGRRYQKKLLNWNTTLSVRYGLNAQQGRELRKTEDQLQILSNFGYRRDSVSNWYYSAKFDFSTQLAVGYRYPDTSTPISKFMAPGYAFLGVGTEYSSPTESFTAYISPVTHKSTFVLDQELANQGRFGVIPAEYDEEGNIIEEGEKLRSEFGFLFNSTINRPVSENINLNSRIRLYSDYLNKFGNIDIDWEINFDLRVNEYVRANVGSHLKYDDDVKFQEDRNGDGVLEQVGPKLQFKQILGVGLVYDF